MYIYKYIILCFLFLIAIPCKVLLAQQTSADNTSAVDSALIIELENQYDSVITKAALSLTGAQYKQAADYYKEASLLKPEETYPLKMIKYVETIMADVAEKQKRADDLKRRAQVKDELNKANNAIVNRSWDSARVLFSRIIALHPDKADEDYAKSKIEAIDLEQKRIILRIPPKPQPVVVAPPKNRSEARARRKLLERNAVLAAAAAAAKSTAEAQAPLTAQNAAVKPVAKETLQKSTAALPPQKTAAIAAPAVKQVPAKPASSPLPTKNAAVAAPIVKEAPKQSATTALPASNVAAAAPAAKEAYHAPAAPPPTKSIATTMPVASEVPKTATETALPATNPPVSASVGKEVPQRSTEVSLPAANTPVAAPAMAKALPQKPVTASLPSNKIAAAAPVINNAHPQLTEPSLPEKTGAAPLANETPTNASLLKLSDSSDYIKIICKDISFIGTNAYVKVLIQNYSSTESFNTDTLQVSIKKNNGSVRKLDQRFISSFPVVTPLQETILVAFTDASIGVDPNDVFVLEMRIRRNKTKLALQIPWALYQEQKNL